MYKLYLVKVGRRTRSGSFQELAARSVSVAEEATVNDLRNYFYPRYKGLDVIIEQPEHEDLPGMPILCKPTEPEPKKRPGIIHFKVKHTDSEAALFIEYKEAKRKAGDLLSDLHRSIEGRYEKLPYVDGRCAMNLTTDSYGTYCGGLKLRSDDFFKVIKDCDDGTAELEITPNEAHDPDLPF